ncbi:sulfotransferase [candidate division KSB1 bacterium]|nr:sulfotransferase [candidate division KSB1 bacterium]RQW11006.1 MAG: hypothetical protein EH222_01560 [candidate division KSB1 bacterium]
MKLFIYRRLLKIADFFNRLTRTADGAAQRLLPLKRISLAACEGEKWQNVRPCFVLSTGRSGTLLLTKLLSLSPHLAVAHQPRPELIRASKLAFERVQDSPEVFRETLKSAREELLLEALRHDQIFVETNNRITFFAPVIRDVFPHARFIHLVRHPGDFVRSGIRRGWYSDKHEHDIGRIVPTGQAQKLWDAWTPIEKIGWLWNETNQFIEEVKSALPADAFLFVKAEDLFADAEVTRNIFSFLGAPAPSLNTIRKNLRPENVQKKGDYPRYRDWPDEDKRLLFQIAPLMEKYGYG